MNRKFLIKSISNVLMLGILCILILLGLDSIVIIKPFVLFVLIIFIVFLSYFYYLENNFFAFKEERLKLVYNIIDYLHVIISAGAIMQLIFLIWFFPATVTQTSMNPTLYENEKIIIIHNNKSFVRFDIVVFKVDVARQVNITKDEDNELWIKRVVGLPGDSIKYHSGKLYVNDELIAEPHLYDDNNQFKQGLYKDKKGIYHEYNAYTQDFTLLTILALNHLPGSVIPDDYFLLLGDNRTYSKDSRQIGLVHRSQIIGKGRYIIRDLITWEKIGG